MARRPARRGSGRVLAGRRERARDPRGAWPTAGAETVQALHARGGAARIDAFKAKDGLGRDVCAPGDFQWDGFPDLALSAEGGGVYFQGESYIVFGGPATCLDAGPDHRGSGSGREGCASSGRRPTTTPRTSRPRATSTAMGSPTSSSPLRASRLAARLTSCSVGRRARSGSGTWETTASAFRRAGRSSSAVHRLAAATSTRRAGRRRGRRSAASSPRLAYIVFGQGPVTFIRGDSNDDDKVELSDPVRLLGYLFLGSEPPPCLDAADGNDSGASTSPTPYSSSSTSSWAAPLAGAPIRTPGSTSRRISYDADRRHEIANLDGMPSP